MPKPEPFEKWAASVPDDFRFAVKLSKSITHPGRLRDTSMLDDFLTGVRHLGGKLGPLLIQLPPNLAFEHEITARFFKVLRTGVAGPLVCEPRHVSWFREASEGVLTSFEIARVAADPSPVPHGLEPAGWRGLAYFRLHGSPRPYYSSDSSADLDALVNRLKACTGASSSWCIFDNTASGTALGNALGLLASIGNRATR